MEDDDSVENVEKLLDDVSINSEEAMRVNQLKKLLPMEGWGFPSWVYAEGSPTGFGKGVNAVVDDIPVKEVLSNRFIPIPMHLFPANAKADDSIINAFHHLLTVRSPLWINFTHITPSLMLLLTGKPPIKRVAFFEFLEKQTLLEYETKKTRYADGHQAFVEMKVMLSQLQEGPEREELQKKVEELSDQFTQLPENFVRTAEGRIIVNQYLFSHRACRIKEDVSLSQYSYGYCPPILNTYEILFRYHRIRDNMEANCGFINPQSDQRNYHQFLDACAKASDQYNTEIEDLNTTFVQKHPELDAIVQSLQRKFDEGYFIPDWSALQFSLPSMINILREYTVGMIAAVERCILTMIGFPEDAQAYLSVERQPLIYNLSEEDESRFSDVEDVRNYNNLVHSLRTEYLPGWKKTAVGDVACTHAQEDPDKVERYVRNLLLNFAFKTYPVQHANASYLQLKQIVRPSKSHASPSYNPRNPITIFETETLEPIDPFY